MLDSSTTGDFPQIPIDLNSIRIRLFSLLTECDGYGNTLGLPIFVSKPHSF